MPVRSAGSVGSGQTYSFALAYSRDALKMAVGYFHIDNGSVTLSSRGINSAGNLFQTPVNAAYASARSINIARAGVTYVLDQVTLGAYYSFAEYVADGSSTFSHSERYNNASAFAMWQISQPFQLEIGYDQLKSDGDSSAIYRRLTFAADYKLSKRTEVYALGGWGGLRDIPARVSLRQLYPIAVLTPAAVPRLSRSSVSAIIFRGFDWFNVA